MPLAFVPLFILLAALPCSPALPSSPNANFLQPEQGDAASAVKPKGAPVDEFVHIDPLTLLVSAPSAYTPWRIAVSGSAVGVVFGLMGSGASMLMKPLLYYGFGQYPFKLTIFEMYSILVPLASFGAARGHSKGNVVWRHVFILASLTSGVGTTLGSLLATAVTSRIQLLIFGALVLLVAVHMTYPSLVSLRREGKDNVSQGVRFASFDFSSALLAIVVGILSGFVGVGGGFMLTPLLCHFGHSMETAVPTALAVICLSACTGIFWYLRLGVIPVAALDWTLIVSFTLAGCVGLLVSDRMSGLVQKAVKQRVFSALLVVIGTGVILTETFAPMH